MHTINIQPPPTSHRPLVPCLVNSNSPVQVGLVNVQLLRVVLNTGHQCSEGPLQMRVLRRVEGGEGILEVGLGVLQSGATVGRGAGGDDAVVVQVMNDQALSLGEGPQSAVRPRVYVGPPRVPGAGPVQLRSASSPPVRLLRDRVSCTRAVQPRSGSMPPSRSLSS